MDPTTKTWTRRPWFAAESSWLTVRAGMNGPYSVRSSSRSGSASNRSVRHLAGPVVHDPLMLCSGLPENVLHHRPQM